MDMLVRRGPDAEGTWSDGRHCTLGFRRLAILDLSPAGNQPLCTADGRYALVFNGELYGFRELRRKLEARGVRFRSTGDAEVVLHALAEWGERALLDFNGMFALAFYDKTERSLLLARDHAGIKPLYYASHREGLFFCSSYEGILAHPWSRTRRPHDDALSLYLHLGYIPAPFAMLEDTHQLIAGSWLRVNASGERRSGTFWEFPHHQVPDLRGDEAIEATDAAITRAVEQQMVSDVPVGAFLSGGIDSPLLTAKMQQVDADVLAFTMGTNGDVHDESADAARYAAELGVRHQIRHIDPEEVRALLDDVVAACAEPFADFSIFPTMLLCRFARERVKVMLAGDGGDELFWGYVQRLGAVLERARRISGSAAAGEIFAATPERGPILGASDLGSLQLRHDTLLPAPWLRKVFRGHPALPALDLYRFGGGDLDRAAQWIRWNEFSGHLARVLDKVDRASMHESLEVRVPLLDRTVIETALRIDFRSCADLDRRVGKLPLRGVLARHVRQPTTTKRGFHPPMAEWLRGPLRGPLEDLVLARDEILGVPLRRCRLRRFYRHHLEQTHDHSWGLWRLLALRLWEERHYRGRGGLRLDAPTAAHP